MRKNSLANLNPAQLVFADFTDDVTSIKLDTVQEFNGIIAAINRLNDKAVLVFIQIYSITDSVKNKIARICDFATSKEELDILLNQDRAVIW